MNAAAALPPRERLVVGGALLAVALIAWAYLFHDARHDCCTIALLSGSTPVAIATLSAMWVAMMIAMMLPTALPMVLTFAAVARSRRAAGRAYVPVAIFVSGYAIVWAVFSVVAALTQWQLHRWALLSEAMASTSALFAGLLLFAAGVFQFTSFKRACLTRCRSPLDFIMTHWREGRGGALRMGLEHGAFCTGCCWALMALLFVLGVMNLLWVAALTALVCIEKMLPARAKVRIATGLLLLGWGAFFLIQAATPLF